MTTRHPAKQTAGKNDGGQDVKAQRNVKYQNPKQIKKYYESTRRRLPTSGGLLWRGRRKFENTKKLIGF